MATIKRLIHKLFGQKTSSSSGVATYQQVIAETSVSKNALKVLRRLQEGGFAAYLVGGSVRDILLKRTPKDFDIATDATPEEVRRLFRNSRIIGRRFRLVHVFFHRDIIEVSTFRANSQDKPADEKHDIELTGRVAADNTYGTIEEDAWRRDFTVNALYCSAEDLSVTDFTGGMKDVKHRLIRMIGDPVQRYHEDPVRLLRAIRLAAKLKFSIEKNTEAPLLALAGLLQHVSNSRLYDETLKLFFEGNAELVYKKLCHYDYLAVLFPQTVEALKQCRDSYYDKLIDIAMHETDVRFHGGKSLNPGFLFSVLLWPVVQCMLRVHRDQHERFYQALHYSIDLVLIKQNETVMIPKRLTAMMRSIWLLQYYLMRRRGRRVYRTLEHRYFRAAYDLLVLRAKASGRYQDVCAWWEEFQTADKERKQHMVAELPGRKKRKKYD